MTTGTPTYQQIEKRLQVMERDLEQYAQLAVVNQFASALMHEINNPLEAMINLVYLLQREDPLPERAEKRLQDLEAQLEILTHVARSSLSFHRGQAVAKEFDLISVAESALRLHLARISERNVEVCRQFPDRAICHGFSGELLQVVSNLILNALDAVPEQASASLHVRIRHGERYVHLTVADNGAGVPEHVHATLFQPHVTSKQNGTGLGLWLSERILARHRGMIRMRTSRTPGRSGTVFRISLPQTKAA